MNLRKSSAVAAAAVCAVALTATVPAFAADPPNIDEMVGDYSVEAVNEHLIALQEIAMANGGNRVAGSSGDDATMDYIQTTLEESGYEVTRQEFAFTYSRVDTSVLNVGGTALESPDAIPMSYSPNTNGVLTGNLVQSTHEDNLGCPAMIPDPNNPNGVIPDRDENGDLIDVPFTEDVVGNVAFVSRGVCSFAAKSEAAFQAGATAAIVYNNVEEPLNGTLGGLSERSVPTYGITPAAAAPFLEATEPVEVSMELDQFIEDRPAYNLFADTPGGDPDNVIVAGAHFDGAEEGPGINDNGTGVAGLLEAAAVLSDYPENVNNKVRFAFWGAEEWGLLGSDHYVYDLAENDPAELATISSYLNFDMIGSENYIVGVYDADQSTYTAPVTIPEGSVAIEKLITDFFDAGDQPWVDTQFSGRSDYEAFILNGIPAGGLFSGADGSKTAEEVEMFGGTAGVPYDVNYHQATDTYENVNQDSLDILAPALGYYVFAMAYDDVTTSDDDPTPTPTPTPTAEPTPSATPSESPSATPSESASASASAEPGEGDGSGDRPPLADTGAGSILIPALLAGAALLGGGYALSRRRAGQ